MHEGGNEEWNKAIRAGPPKEWTHYQIMKHMRWSWEDLMDTPTYVIEWLTRCIKIDIEHRNAEAKAAAAQAKGGK